MSRSANDIDQHKVISNMPIGPSGKLHVDFLLKNSKYHITETLDFRKSETAGEREIKNAALVNVTLRHAKAEFAALGSHCYLLYAASNIVERSIYPALKIAEEESDQIFNTESKEDRDRYLDIILEATGTHLPI